MLTLSYGFKKPQSNDKGSVFWAALETNFQKLNDHTHNGTNSAKLTAASADAVLVDVLAASWGSADAAGTRYQDVVVPGTIDATLCDISFRDASTADAAYLQYKVSGVSAVRVYCNDNSKSFKMVLTT